MRCLIVRELHGLDQWSTVLGLIWNKRYMMCNYGVRASRRISHNSHNPNRKFLGCSNYKSQDDKGSKRKFFEWYGVKVAVSNEKLRLGNIVEDLTNKLQQLRVENLEIQAAIARVSTTTRGTPSMASNLDIENQVYMLRKEVDLIKSRVYQLERIYRPKFSRTIHL
ncbi:hypothetical protein LINGRAHAP2_LOCUS27943 [Linum grandiflorum]